MLDHYSRLKQITPLLKLPVSPERAIFFWDRVAELVNEEVLSFPPACYFGAETKTVFCVPLQDYNLVYVLDYFYNRFAARKLKVLTSPPPPPPPLWSLADVA